MILDIETVKQELRITSDDDDERIVRKMDEATAIVLDYLKVPADTYEDVDGNDDLPEIVFAAVLEVLRMQYDEPDKDPINAAVKSVLMRMRDPAVA
jgi:hypothetical protein